MFLLSNLKMRQDRPICLLLDSTSRCMSVRFGWVGASVYDKVC